MKYLRHAVLLTATASGVASFAQSQPKLLSLVQLLAAPEKFDGALISVRGFLVRSGGNHDMAATFLYLHKEDADNELDDSILVGPSEQARKDLLELDRKYVTLVGTFRAVRAANGAYISEITHVQSCRFWSDPSHPIGLGESGAKK